MGDQHETCNTDDIPESYERATTGCLGDLNSRGGYVSLKIFSSLRRIIKNNHQGRCAGDEDAVTTTWRVPWHPRQSANRH